MNYSFQWKYKNTANRMNVEKRHHNWEENSGAFTQSLFCFLIFESFKKERRRTVLLYMRSYVMWMDYAQEKYTIKYELRYYSMWGKLIVFVHNGNVFPLFKKCLQKYNCFPYNKMTTHVADTDWNRSVANISTNWIKLWGWNRIPIIYRLRIAYLA